ncbi:MAG: alcohol dehydrogenase catalytic domain-containing protein [Planctomycetota bacterium]|nr:alcohol dehydrogenase catalytic domain-containing protein [Planctomycetota bacterium]MDA1250062.1 alcohol dehydrogenase catalytic domain-containing protein [Planctomycetota bacterium]
MPAEMRAIHLSGKTVELRSDHPVPRPKVGPESEVLVKVIRAGVCETDLQLIQGYMGFEGVLGHEFVGIAQSGPLRGERVVGEINCSCFQCGTCRSGLPTHCPNRTVLGILGHDGAFADFISVPQKNLHRVPEALSTDVAVFVEPVAAAYQILRQQLVEKHHRAAVLGDGRLGNLCAQVLADFGCEVLVVGKHENKLQILRDLGIETGLLNEVTPARKFDVVVDCTGSASGLLTALQFVKPWGTIILKTTVSGEQTMAFAPIVIDEVRVIGSRCGPFSDAIAGLEAGRIQVEPLISGRFPLDKGVEAIHHTAQNPVLKILIDIDHS